MERIRIFGGSFLEYSYSFSCREECVGLKPAYFEWCTENETLPVHVYTGSSIFDKIESKDVTNIALLIEPMALRPENYHYIALNHSKFDRVLTYNEWLYQMIPNGSRYTLGGCSILEPEITEKTKDFCMIASYKHATFGHKLRQAIIRDCRDYGIDFYGAGVGRPFPSTKEILAPYRYCIVVESSDEQFYFSEKLMDAMSMGCYPIYWRTWFEYASYYEEYGEFDTFDNISMLKRVLENKQLEINRQEYSKINATTAANNRIAEDGIWTTLERILDGRQRTV